MQAKTRISWYRMSDFSGIDRAYLSRLKNGQATNPSVNTVFRLSCALTKDGAERYDLDRLLISAGYHPVFEITYEGLLQMLAATGDDIAGKTIQA